MGAAIMPISDALDALVGDFQLAAPLAGKRIVVAMSGGVDSSVVAALAARSGAEVIGVTLQLYDSGAKARRPGACCAGQDIRDARAVADRLGFAHYVHDHESRFRDSVIDQFADEYLAGRTPIPCVRCNMGVKFTDLFALAKELGADCLATGHYVRRVMGADGPELHRAVDPARDQSYFLFATTREQLDFLRFPLGGMPKSGGTRDCCRAGPGRRGQARQPGYLLRSQTAIMPRSCARCAPMLMMRAISSTLDGRVLGPHKGTDPLYGGPAARD